MKKIFNLLTALVLLTSTVCAQTTTDQDPKAKAVLDKLSAKTKGYSSISASFNSTLDNKKANLKVNQKGNLKIKGNKYKIELDDYTVINDGKTGWTYTKEANEVQVDDAAEMKKGGGIKPSEIFTIWENGFRYKYEKEVTIAGAKCDIIKLFPKDTKGKNYHTIVLTINKTKMEVQNVEVLGKSGEIYTYQVTKFAPNAALADADFNFDKTKYPGVEVIDNR
ncbi:MAG: outer membrane lipoprotein carrier protein LolA [Bacteroidota bacterium]